MGKRASSVHRSRGGKSKKLLASLLIVGATGIAGVGATTSSFTDSATAKTTVVAGSINLTANNSSALTYNLGASGKKWAPGDSETATITLRNTGTLPMTVNMSTTSSGGTSGLANKLRATIKNGSTTLGTAGIMRTRSFSGLSIPAGGSAVLTVTVNWPTTGTDHNNYAGNTDTVTFTFSATNS